MNKRYKNLELKGMLNETQPLLSMNGKLGYAAARNSRKIQDALTEYLQKEAKLFEKYGEKEKDKNGNETGRLYLDANNTAFKEFVDELLPFLEIEHDVEIMCLKYEEVMDVLTGEEMLAISWMLVDELEG